MGMCWPGHLPRGGAARSCPWYRCRCSLHIPPGVGLVLTRENGEGAPGPGRRGESTAPSLTLSASSARLPQALGLAQLPPRVSPPRCCPQLDAHVVPGHSYPSASKGLGSQMPSLA